MVHCSGVVGNGMWRPPRVGSVVDVLVCGRNAALCWCMDRYAGGISKNMYFMTSTVSCGSSIADCMAQVMLASSRVACLDAFFGAGTAMLVMAIKT